MWRHLLYAVYIGEAALLAAILVAMVVQPDLVGFAPSPSVVGSARGARWR